MTQQNVSLISSARGQSAEPAGPGARQAESPEPNEIRRAPASRPPRRRAWRKLLILAGLLALLAAAVPFVWKQFNGATSTVFTTEPAVRGEVLQTVTSLGSLQPKDYVDVGAQVSGQVEKVYVDIGDTVEKDQLLADIDPTLYEAAVRADEAKLDDLRAQFKQYKAEMDLARIQAERNQDLHESAYVSQDTLDQAVTEARVAQAKVEAIQAQIKQYESSLEEAKANLGYCKIYAPMSGTVSDQTTLEGQTVNANQSTPVILTIADLGTMTVEAEVSEADVVKVRSGMRAWFTTLGLTDRQWWGQVRQILPTPELVNDVVLYHVLMDVDNSDGVLMTEMTAQVFFVIAEAQDAVLVPVEALSSGPDGGQVVRVLGQSGPETRAVEVGVANRSSVQILSGVQDGELVITGVAEGADLPDAAKGGMPPMPGGGARL